jgi:pimeloyl-ACP methyl ester carboxylesterase
MRFLNFLSAIATLAIGQGAQAAFLPSTSATITYHKVEVGGVGIFYREAGPKNAPTFDHLAQTTNDLLEQLGINKYIFYLQDYGGPVGFRIMLQHPERVQALVIHNANAYEAGLGPKWTKFAKYWADPKAHPEVIDTFVALDDFKHRHIAGSPNPERYNPDTWTDEYAVISRPGEKEIQGDLLYDYRSNVASYPKWQA